MLRPYSRRETARARCLADDWTEEGWTLLERHESVVAAPPAEALRALATMPLRELPAVRALFTLRGMRHSADMTVGAFFSRAPFVVLAEEPGRELVSGVLRAPRGRSARAEEPHASTSAFARALPTAPFAAIATFRADPLGERSLLWTETWARTRGAGARAVFGAYWLAIGPWSAWIRRMLLRGARARAEGPASDRLRRSS